MKNITFKSANLSRQIASQGLSPSIQKLCDTSFIYGIGIGVHVFLRLLSEGKTISEAMDQINKDLKELETWASAIIAVPERKSLGRTVPI